MSGSYLHLYITVVAGPDHVPEPDVFLGIHIQQIHHTPGQGQDLALLVTDSKYMLCVNNNFPFVLIDYLESRLIG